VASAEFFVEGHHRRPCGRRAPLSLPSPRTLRLSSRATRVVERTLARSLVHAIACASLKSIPIDPSRQSSPPPFPQPSRSLAPRSFVRSPSLPFDEGAQSRTQDPRRLRHGPHCAAVADGLRRSFVRPTDRPRSVARA